VEQRALPKPIVSNIASASYRIVEVGVGRCECEVIDGFPFFEKGVR
jgi:hypothetical protein